MSTKSLNFLECTVCFEKFDPKIRRPLLLLCGHSFCKICVEALIVQKSIVCPTCRQKTPANEAIKCLKANFALIELLDTIATRGGEICEECEEKTAVSWCEACDVSFCLSCDENIHKRGLKRHKRAVLDDKASRTCQKHKNENLSFFCFDCDTPICNICRDSKYGTHSSHEVELIDGVDKIKRKVLTDSQTVLTAHIEQLEELSTNVAVMVNSLSAKKDEALRIIEKDFQKIQTALEHRRRLLVDSVKSQAKAGEGKLQTQRSNLAGLIATARILREEFDQISERKTMAMLQNLPPLYLRFQDTTKSITSQEKYPVVNANVIQQLPSDKLIDSIKRYGSVDICGPSRVIPLIICAKDVTSSSLKLEWRVDSPKDIQTFVVQYKVAEEKDDWKEAKRTSTTYAVIDSLTRNTSYDFQVCGLSKVFRDVGGFSDTRAYSTLNTIGKVEFTACGVTGHKGPTDKQGANAYKGTVLKDLVTFKKGIQYLRVPSSGVFKIEAYGARGASATEQKTPGKGAKMVGEFKLTAGQTLNILVGQEGTAHGGNGGGGGGTFVVGKSGIPLIVAGGGGGLRQESTQAGFGGLTSTFGGTSTGQTSSGHQSAKTSDKRMGGKITSNGYGSSGAGFEGDGLQDNKSVIAKSFLHGGEGGHMDNLSSSQGGFGGGGSGCGCNGAGGAGGYSGGDSGWVAGGGGSYNDGDNPDNAADFNDGPGRVVIHF